MILLGNIQRAWIEWIDSGPSPAQRRPTVLQFPVNDICNSRCQMCHIWQRKRDHEISADELEGVLQDPLFRDVRNVGINGGEPTLRRDLGQLVDVMVRRLPRFSGLSLITNALQPARVIASIDNIGRRCKEAGALFDVMVSLDGIGEIHDRVRGVRGNFENALLVIRHVLQSPLVDSQRIGCTIVAENVFDLENVIDYARSIGIYARFRLGVPHQRLYTSEIREPFMLDDAGRFHLAAFLDGLVLDYERNPVRQAFYRSLRDQVIYGRPRAAGCPWKNHGVTLSSRGELSFCAVASPTLGDATTQSASKLYWNGAPVLKEILRDNCSGCRHDYEGIGNRALLIRSWLHHIERRLPARLSNSLRATRHDIRLWNEWRTVLQFPQPVRPRLKRVPSILLCGWYGTETLGDRAILAGLCRMLHDERPDAKIDIASLEPYVTRETLRLMPELGIRTIQTLADASRRAGDGEYTAVAIAGGPLMTPVREILDLYRLLRIARRAGSQLAILGCGIGPIGRESARRHALSWMIREADTCVLRDTISTKLAADLCGRKGSAEAACDPAFFWEALQSSGPMSNESPATVALALREWTPHAYAADRSSSEAHELKKQFEYELSNMIRRLLDAPEVNQVVPVCMHTLAAGGDDRAFYRRLLHDQPNLLRQLGGPRHHPLVELNLLRKARVVCAMRFHSVVFSLALQKPFLAIDYTQGGKTHALLKDHGRQASLVELETFRGEEAAKRLRNALTDTSQRAPIDLAASEATYRSAVAKLFL